MTNDEQIPLIKRGEDFVAGEGNNSPVEWVGLPRFVAQPKRISLVLAFDSESDREELLKQLASSVGIREVPIAKKTGNSWSAHWPPRKKEELAHLRFDFEDAD